MVLKNIFSKAKSALASGRKKISKSRAKKRVLPPAKMEAVDAPNRFLRFYYANRKELLAERKDIYNKKLKKRICVRCRQKAVSGIKYCFSHQQKQKVYNRRSRERRKRESEV